VNSERVVGNSSITGITDGLPVAREEGQRSSATVFLEVDLWTGVTEGICCGTLPESIPTQTTSFA
jgi:hypothetical protein